VYSNKVDVIDVQPFYTHVADTQCQQNKLQVRSETEQFTTTLAGAVIGGIVGNRFGKGQGKTVMTIAGTILGAVAANQYNHNNAKQHCRHERQAKHYLVSYRYQGKRYQTLLDYHPQKSLPTSRYKPANKGYF
jgi:uncharacterized protein YcfJ